MVDVFTETLNRFLIDEEEATWRLMEFYARASRDLEYTILHADLTASDQAYLTNLRGAVDAYHEQLIRGGGEWANTTVATAYVEGARTHEPDISFAAVHDDAVRALSKDTLDLITRTSLEVRSSISNAIAQGMLQGLSGAELRVRILQSGLKNIPKWPSVEYRAGVIARTETMRAYNAGAMAGIESTGAPAVEWIVSPDEATCKRCAPRSGRIYLLDSAVGTIEYEEAVDRWPKALPLDRHPPLHPRCRCTVRARYPATADEPDGVPPPVEPPAPKPPPAAGDFDAALARLANPSRDTFDADKLFWRTVDLDDAMIAKLASRGYSQIGYAMGLRYGIGTHPNMAKEWTEKMYAEWIRSLEAVRKLVPRYVVDSLTLKTVGDQGFGGAGGNAIAWASPFSGIYFRPTKWMSYIEGRSLRGGPGVRAGMEVAVHEIGHTVHFRYGLNHRPIEFLPPDFDLPAGHFSGTPAQNDAIAAAYAARGAWQGEWEAVRKKSRGMPIAPTNPADDQIAMLRERIEIYDREIAEAPNAYMREHFERIKTATLKRIKQIEKVATGKADYYPTEYAKSGGDAEDFAESFMLYVLNPAKLKAQAPNRYEFMRTKVFAGEGGV